MNININTDGTILSAGYGLGWLGYPPSAPLPADFMDTFALGKYQGRIVEEQIPLPMPEIVDGDDVPEQQYEVRRTVEVYAVPGWTPPEPTPE